MSDGQAKESLVDRYKQLTGHSSLITHPSLLRSLRGRWGHFKYSWGAERTDGRACHRGMTVLALAIILQ